MTNLNLKDEFTKEEYAEVMWGGIMEMVAELNDSECPDRDKMFQLFGYMEAYKATDSELKHDYETR